MISHKHKVIFLHIPKCAGTSINQLLSDNKNFNYLLPDYEYLYGWCPKRKIFMQHATVQELIELELISNDIWDNYYKFTIVRNPWDRIVSSYNWIKNNLNLDGSLTDFLFLKNSFSLISDLNPSFYRADHLKTQSEFIFHEDYHLDAIFNFKDIGSINFKELFNCKNFELKHHKKSKSKKHYSSYYTNTQIDIVNEIYSDDISNFSFKFEDKRKGLSYFKKFF